MRTKTLLASGIAALLTAGVALAQAPAQQPAAPQPYRVGTPLGATNEAGQAQTMSNNVKVYGSFHFAESCTFDPTRNVIVAMNAGNAQNLAQNDGFVSLINPDGSVHTSKWIGVTRDELTLNHPLGSAIQGNTLYTVDIDTIRTFDLASGKPGRAIKIDGATILNGIGVTTDGVIYTSNTREPERIYRVQPNGVVSTFVEGAPLALPNGVAIDTGRQRRRRQHRQQGRHHVQPSRPGRAHRASGRGRQRRRRRAARRHEVREQRALRQRVADSPRPAGRGHRDGHPERGVDVLRLAPEPARDSAESEQRAGVHSAGPRTLTA